MRGIFLECAVALAKRSKRRDQLVLRIDFENRLGRRSQPAGTGKEPFEGAVGPLIGRDQADGAVGKTIRGAHLRHGVAQRRFDESEKILDRLGNLGRRICSGIEARNKRKISRALGYRLERLAIKTFARHHPEGVDWIGQQQDLNAAGAKALQMRR